MVFNNVTATVTISCHSFVFSQSCIQISAGLTDIDVSGLAITAFHCVNCSAVQVLEVRGQQW